MVNHQDETESLFREGYNCAQSVFTAFCDVTVMDKISRISVISVISMLMLLAVAIIGCSSNNLLSNVSAASKTETTNYGALFDDSVIHHIDITMNEADWADLKNHAIDKKKYHANVTVDGENVSDVAVSAKGSQSLRQPMVNEKTNRYSLKLKFDKFQDKQKYHGLDSLTVCNNYNDASQMKNYFVYKMFRKMGVPAALSSYAKITVNGELYGIFTIAEDIDKSFLQRNFAGKGKLYKPENSQVTAMNAEDDLAVKAYINNGTTYVPKKHKELLENMNPYCKGADLRYTDNNPKSYSEIFNNNVKKIDDADKDRLIQALRNLSLGQPEKAVDINEVITYFAGNIFVENYDSYLSKICHNYYLYEHKGIMLMMPWDYDYPSALCSAGRMDSLYADIPIPVTADIDNPLTVPNDSRGMWNWIVSDSKYMARYHKTMARLLATCFDSGWAVAEIDRTNKLIRDEVKNDPNAIYSIEEYDAAVADLRDFFSQRSQEVHEQLGDVSR